MGPLYDFGRFDYFFGLQMALLLGFFFGLLLERAGFGNPRKLVAVFYLKDFAVLKVMFTAIVVCAIGLLYFSTLGWIDLSEVYLLPTYIWPQIVGGLLLGAGFVIGGYCPTTSVVATVSGRLDGLIFLVGMVLGSFIFAELFPVLQGFYESGHMGSVRLSDVLNINSGIIALLVSIMAVVVFWFVEKVEQRFGDRDLLPVGSKKAKRTAAGLVVALGLVLAIINPDAIVAKKAGEQGRQAEQTEEVQKATAPAEEKQEEEGSSDIEFTIVEDEGC